MWHLIALLFAYCSHHELTIIVVLMIITMIKIMILLTRRVGCDGQFKHMMKRIQKSRKCAQHRNETQMCQFMLKMTLAAMLHTFLSTLHATVGVADACADSC